MLTGSAAFKGISIHALREEGDGGNTMARHRKVIFLSTPSARRATYIGYKLANFNDISIHALREEGDCSSDQNRRSRHNFYPRPPRGGRRRNSGGKQNNQTFLSTPSARRATDYKSVLFKRFCISIHALREEGDPLDCFGVVQRQVISIHALREEGDCAVIAACGCRADFYPRPPRGGRQSYALQTMEADDISIHALREEGDLLHAVDKLRLLVISIHALREEGDRVYQG